MALVDRVKNILLTPRQEWAVIDAEPTTPVELYKEYIMPLAAIGPVAGMIGSTVFGYRIPMLGTYRAPVGQALSAMVVTYLLTLGGVYVLALIIDALAPSFNGTKSQTQALKVAAYSSTASWVAGIFSLIPALRWLGILGLYSLYLLYLGLPVLMKAPEEKALAYTILVILAALVLFLVIGLVAGSFLSGPMM
jgi:Yip1 domain